MSQDFNIDDKDVIYQKTKEDRADDPHYRLSPEARHRVYKDYKLGMNIRDISLKYGILPERACAIIWTLEYYFKVVYPKVGESVARMSTQMEFDYGDQFGFVDYGPDLEDLANHEQGVPVMVIGRTAAEKNPKPAEKTDMEKIFRTMKGRRIFEVPIKHTGKGPGGYLLKELVCRVGKNSVKPTKGLVENYLKANKIRSIGY